MDQKMAEICRLIEKMMQILCFKIKSKLSVSDEHCFLPNSVDLLKEEDLNKDLRMLCKSIIRYRVDAAVHFEKRKCEVLDSLINKELIVKNFGEQSLNKIYESIVNILFTSMEPNFTNEICQQMIQGFIARQLGGLPGFSGFLRDNWREIKTGIELQLMQEMYPDYEWELEHINDEGIRKSYHIDRAYEQRKETFASQFKWTADEIEAAHQEMLVKLEEYISQSNLPQNIKLQLNVYLYDKDWNNAYHHASNCPFEYREQEAKWRKMIDISYPKFLEAKKTLDEFVSANSTQTE